MLEITKGFEKRLKHMRNDVYMWEMAYVFEKRLTYLGNDVDMLEMAKTFWKITEIFDKRL